MVAVIRDGSGRVINARAGLAEVQAAMKLGCKIAAVIGFGAGRLIQGRVSSIEGGRVVIDGHGETIDPRDVCAIVTDIHGAENDRKNPTD